MNPALTHVDVCFVVDTTGSMGSFIAEAKRRLLDAVETLGREQGLDLRFGLVEYRDHPPEDRSFVFRVTQLTHKVSAIQRAINRMQASGGGDHPESVYDGVHVACVDQEWRPHSLRVVLLVGDAPPHGAFAHLPPSRRRRTYDRWQDGCPCGLTLHSVTAAAEEAGVTVHAITMGADALTRDAFTDMARGTGGTASASASANQVVGEILNRLRADFAHIEFDGRVLETIERLGLDVEAVAENLKQPRVEVAASVSRLGRRGFLVSDANRQP